MNYPLQLSFKLLALASQIYVRDANGNLLGYVKQKMFKLKEDIRVFADEGQTQLRFGIKANKILDFSANYTMTDANGNVLGSIKRQGMRSIWKAHYLIFDANNQQVMEIHEENAWVKVMDALLGEVPVVGMFTGYLFNPAYIVSRMNNQPVMRLQKEPAFFEGKFKIEPQGQINQEEENLVILALLTMVLLERSRG